MVEVSNSYLATLATPTIAEVASHRDIEYAAFRPAVEPVPYPDSGVLESSEWEFVDVKKTPPVIERDNGYLAERATVGAETWWESFHVIPRDFDFGNLLSTQTSPIEVYSAFRRDDQDWTAFVNNAGAGVSITGLPSFPQTFVPQSNAGLTLELVVSPSGQPNVDTTLDFVFGTVPQTVEVPIILSRVVLWSVRPELPFTERLQWLTEVMEHIDGTEQRHSARKNPRQQFEWDFILEDDGIERSFFHNVFFDWQGRIFGLPLWFEATRLTQAVTAGDTTLNVASTANADYRVGGLIVVFDGTNFDVLELDSLTATSLTTVGPTQNNYSVGVQVMPLRTGYVRRQVQGSRFVSGAARMSVVFTVDDNDADLADVSAWSSYNSKVLIDGCNSVRGTMSETFDREIVFFDHQIGVPSFTTPWDTGKRISQLGLLAKGQAGLWEVRQLLHALRGKQVSFYCSSFTNDFVVDGDVPAGTIINVKHCGYTQFVQNRQPRNVIRIVYNNGDPDDIREIVGSSEVDADTEALTLDMAVAAHSASEVEKIMYVEKVRWDSDSLTIRHELGDTTKRITGPIRTVFE